MKKMILLLVLAGVGAGQLGAVGVKEHDSSEFFLSLSLIRDETSKDSNRRETSLEIRDGAVTYFYHYGGFPDKRVKEKKYKLSRENEEKLVEYIRENQLNKDVEEMMPAEGMGIAINLRLEIQIESDRTLAAIIGRSNIWGNDSSNKKTNLQNLDYYHAVQSLLVFLRNQFGFDIIL